MADSVGGPLLRGVIEEKGFWVAVYSLFFQVILHVFPCHTPLAVCVSSHRHTLFQPLGSSDFLICPSLGLSDCVSLQRGVGWRLPSRLAPSLP